jgi:hypothetical protein
MCNRLLGRRSKCYSTRAVRSALLMVTVLKLSTRMITGLAKQME